MTWLGQSSQIFAPEALAPASVAPVLTPRFRRTLGVLVAALLLLPIRIGSFQGVELSVGMIAFVVAAPFLALTTRTWAGWHLVLALGASFCALLAGIVVAQDVSVRPFISFAYFWLPVVFYPAGAFLLLEEEDFARVLRWGAVIGAWVGVLVTLSLLVSGMPVRTEGLLNGTFLGMPLYAAYGVNTLATIYAIQWCLILADLLFGAHPSLPARLFRLTGLACLSYLLVFSLSRGSILGCLAFLLATLTFLLVKRPRKGIFLLSILVLVGGFAAQQYGDLIALTWAAKLDARRDDYDAVDQVTSGRAQLYVAALEDVQARPLIGSAFGGFLAHPGKSRDEGDEVNSSPHNQYLTIIWKMGVPAGLIYLWFLLRVTSRSLGRGASSRLVRRALVLILVSLMVTSLMVWDALLVPSVGGFFLFLLGGLAESSRSAPVLQHVSHAQLPHAT